MAAGGGLLSSELCAFWACSRCMRALFFRLPTAFGGAAERGSGLTTSLNETGFAAAPEARSNSLCAACTPRSKVFTASVSSPCKEYQCELFYQQFGAYSDPKLARSSEKAEPNNADRSGGDRHLFLGGQAFPLKRAVYSER